MSNQKNKKPSPPTVITLTLVEQDAETRTGTLVIQRGNLAHMRQFTYTALGDLTANIKEGVVALTHIEANPPKEVVSPTSVTKNSTKVDVKPDDEEPTVDVPLKKGTMTIKISQLKIVGGETDAAAYRQAVLIAGKLIDGKLWDGTSPIRIDDVYAVQRKLKHLTERDLSMFELTDFVQIGEANTSSEPIQPNEEERPTAADIPAAAEVATISANGAADQSTLL